MTAIYCHLKTYRRPKHALVDHNYAIKSTNYIKTWNDKLLSYNYQITVETVIIRLKVEIMT